MELPRFVYGIEGKSGRIPNPFGKPGVAQDGLRMSLDDQLRPYVLTDVSQNDLEDEGTQVRITMDAKDFGKLPDIVRKVNRRVLEKKYPEISPEDITRLAEDTARRVPQNTAQSNSRPSIQWPISVDQKVWAFEYAKIAYEIAFLYFGFPYVEESSTAKSLRECILGMSPKDIRGEVPADPIEDLKSLSGHLIVVIGGACMIKVFELWGTIYFEEANRRFILPREEARLYQLDYKDRTWIQHLCSL